LLIEKRLLNHVVEESALLRGCTPAAAAQHDVIRDPVDQGGVFARELVAGHIPCVLLEEVRALGRDDPGKKVLGGGQLRATCA